ncbi:MAG: Gldg family protein [Clostridia bacterium]|nr:Gldg family protein [Clostridia bacterium]
MKDIKNKIKQMAESDGFSSTTMTALVIAVVMVVNIFLYIVVQAFGLYLYKIENDDLSLSGATDALFAEAISEGKKVKVSFCMTEDVIKTHDTGAFVYKTAKYFEERYEGFIELDFINIITQRNEHGELISLSKYKTDMYGAKTPIYASSVIFEYEDNYRVVSDTYTTAGFAPFFVLDSELQADAYNGEEVFAGMVSWVLSSEHKRAYFTSHHGETADLAFSNLLSYAGYYVDLIDLRKEEVPKDADLVIISNPTSDFESGSGLRAEIDRLKSYADEGGNIMVMLDPYVKTLATLEAFLAEYGIAFSTTENKQGKKIRNMIKDPNGAVMTDGFTLVTEYSSDPLAKAIEKAVSTYTDGSVLVREVSALSLSDGAKPLLISSSSSVLEAGGKTVARGGSYCAAAYASRDTENGKTNIFVVPSAYIAVSDAIVTTGYSNRDFMYAIFEYLYGAKGMPYGSNVAVYDAETLENLKMGTAKIYTAIIMAIPATITLVGVAVITKRKNR